MRNNFEHEFSRIQTDMVSICLEYVEDKANKLYIYASYEQNAIVCNFFYNINGMLYRKHKLPNGYDVSIGRQRACMNILLEDMRELISVCEEFGADMPTEIKIIYDIDKNKLDAAYRYENVHSHTKKSANDIMDEWYNEISSS